MNTMNDKMPPHYDIDSLGEAQVGKHFKAYKEFKRTRGTQKKPTKVAISIRLDEDIIEAYKAKGKGWQTRLNDALRDSLTELSTLDVQTKTLSIINYLPTYATHFL